MSRVMINLETMAREIGYKIKDEQGIWIFEQGIEYIQSAIQAVRDETLDDAILACNHAWTKAGNRLPTHADCIVEIKSLKERK